MKYSQAVVLALAAGASVTSARPTRAARVGHRVGKGAELAGTFANAAQGIAPSFQGRSLATDPASQDPAAQTQTQTSAQAPLSKPHHKKHKKHHKHSGNGKGKSKKASHHHDKITGSKASTPTSNTTAEATPASNSTSAATAPAQPVARELNENEESVFMREFDEELEARFMGRVHGALRGGFNRFRKHHGGAPLAPAPDAGQQQPEGRSFDDLEARYPRFGRIGIVVHPHPPVQPLQGRDFDEEELEMRGFDELEARFPGMGRMRGGFSKFRKHGGPTAAPAPPAPQPEGRGFEDDFELEARFPGMGRMRGPMHGGPSKFRKFGGGGSHSVAAPQPEGRSFDDEDLERRDFDDGLEARFLGLSKVLNTLKHFGKHSPPNTPASDGEQQQPQSRSLLLDELD